MITGTGINTKEAAAKLRARAEELRRQGQFAKAAEADKNADWWEAQ